MNGVIKDPVSAMEEVAYRDCIARAIADEMRIDETVLIMGEDIGESGGPLATTGGLFEEFGPQRVRDTPISESAFVGAALGLALTGYRPVVEVMFADFLGVCFDQVANSIAKHRFMSGGTMSVPLVIRVMGGGGLNFAPQHSQTCESWLLSVEGLKIVCPSSPAEAYGMLRSAIRDNDPVIVFEHKALLGTKGPVSFGNEGFKSLCGSGIVRGGKDISVVASLAMVARAVDAAETLKDEGIDVEVIDIRVLRPYASDVINESIKRTGRVITVEEQAVDGGWGSMVVANIVENCFDYLDAPPVRVGLSPGLHPYSPPLEASCMPDAAGITVAVKRCVMG